MTAVDRAIGTSSTTTPNAPATATSNTAPSNAPAAPPAAGGPSPRRAWRAVALPTEHGGWGLTVEPGVLGLVVAPSVAGACIAVGAVVAFLARTPLKIALVDRRRGRDLDRTRLARRVAAAEVAVLVALAVGAILTAQPGFWIPGAVAVPLLALEGWYDVRSRGRRLVPELAGSIGVCSVAAMVLLAGGESGRLAVGAWLVLAARVATSIPHVRAQIARLHGRPSQARTAAIGDLGAVALAVAAVALDHRLAAGAVAIAVVIAAQRFGGTRPVPRPMVLGLRQMAFGFGVVLVAAVGVLVSAA